MFRSRSSRSQSSTDGSVKSSSSPPSNALLSSSTFIQNGSDSAHNTNGNSCDLQPLRTGIIKKFRNKSKKFFVLWSGKKSANESSARLEYFETEKKFRSSGRNLVKRCILLSDVFAVLPKNDPAYAKKGHVFAIYTRDDCFALWFDDKTECDSWLALLQELHLNSVKSPLLPHQKCAYGEFEID